MNHASQHEAYVSICYGGSAKGVNVARLTNLNPAGSSAAFGSCRGNYATKAVEQFQEKVEIVV
jgi:hypothetical protein